MMILFEILGGIVFFGIAGILSLLILPSLLGCFGFIAFWIVLIAILMVFSISIKWIIIFAAIVYAILLLNKWSRYTRLSDYDGYLASNANVYNNGKVVCKYCGSEHVINCGLFGKSGRLRYYMCLNCRNWLYRFKVL